MCRHAGCLIALKVRLFLDQLKNCRCSGGTVHSIRRRNPTLPSCAGSYGSTMSPQNDLCDSGEARSEVERLVSDKSCCEHCLVMRLI